MRKVNTLLLLAGLIVVTPTAFAAKVNPYDYSKHKNAINDAKWQRGHSSEQRCYSTGCESTMDSNSNQKYIWADNKNSQLHFSTDGNQDTGWRSELRFNANFFRGSSRTLTARFGYWAGRSTSKGFTVAQLHMDGNEGWTVKGPPARLEIIDEDYFEVTFRKGHDCTSSCWTDERFSTSVSGWKDIQLQTSGNYINVTVQGQTHSYNLSGSGKDWPSKGGYYWKTGLYMQKSGTAYTGYKHIYW